jgi:hypothetical protein
MAEFPGGALGFVLEWKKGCEGRKVKSKLCAPPGACLDELNGT